MVSRENGFGQIAECFAAIATKVMLTIGLNGVVSVFDDVIVMAMRTFNPFGPAEASHHLVAFGVIDQSVNIESHPAFFP